MTLAQATAKRILELANQNNYSLKVLSELSDVSVSTVKNMIYNKTKNPSSAIIYKICVTLNIKMAEFYDSELFDKIVIYELDD